MLLLTDMNGTNSKVRIFSLSFICSTKCYLLLCLQTTTLDCSVCLHWHWAITSFADIHVK